MRSIAQKPGRQGSQHGFTLVELMIATAVFSVILLLCTSGLIQIGRFYYKGITQSRTQEVARLVIDDISRSIQFGGGTFTPPVTASPGTGTLDRFCIGNKRYSFLIRRQISDSPTGNQRRNALVVDESASCTAQDLNPYTPSLSAGSRELLSPGMRLAKLEIANPPGTNLYTITVRIISGDDDLLEPSLENCTNARAGGQFCAVSELSTVIKKRVQ